MKAHEPGRYAVTQVCRVMGISRAAFYRAKQRRTGPRPSETSDRDTEVVDRIRRLVRRFPQYGYRRIWALLRFGENPLVVNKKRVQRLMQVHGLQVRRPPYAAVRRAHTGRVEVNASDLMWGIDMTKIWCGQEGWASLFAVMDHCDRACVGFRFSRDGKADRACEALDEAIVSRFASPQAVPADLQLRADNGSQFSARVFLRETQRLGVEVTYTPYRSPQGNAIVERCFRSLKEECVWHYAFHSFEEAEAVIAEWIQFYNDERVHSRLGYRSPRQFREFQALRDTAA